MRSEWQWCSMPDCSMHAASECSECRAGDNWHDAGIPLSLPDLAQGIIPTVFITQP